MKLHRKRNIRRWVVRIMLLIVLLPIATLITVRYAGWFRMRKSDKEIKAFLAPHHVSEVIDTFTLRGRQIVYLKTTVGDKKDNALIFVHGSPGSMDAFLDYMMDTSLLSLSDLITYDRPGFGNSNFGRSMPSLTGQSDVLYGLMQSLGYKKYWLAGHSYGASILLHAAIRHPGKVAGICLISGSVSPELEPKAVWRKWIDIPVIRGLLPVSMRVSNEELMPLRQDLYMIEDDWDRIRIPVSLIHGRKDILVPFENLNYAKEKLTKSDTVLTKIFENESHFILWTHQQEIVEEFIRWMKIET